MNLEGFDNFFPSYSQFPPISQVRLRVFKFDHILFFDGKSSTWIVKLRSKMITSLIWYLKVSDSEARAVKFEKRKS